MVQTDMHHGGGETGSDFRGTEVGWLQVKACGLETSSAIHWPWDSGPGTDLPEFWFSPLCNGDHAGNFYCWVTAKV